MTEEEAKNKVCPLRTMVYKFPEGWCEEDKKCIAHECMMWKWAISPEGTVYAQSFN